MRGLILVAIACSIAPYKMNAQAAKEISIDKRAIVNGVKVKSVSLRKDPKTRKINRQGRYRAVQSFPNSL